MKHADEMEGLYRADVTIEEFNTEMKGELKKIKEELSKQKLL